MTINAKIREEIQNINSQLNTRARFQTPIPTSLPASCGLLQLLARRLERTSRIQFVHLVGPTPGGATHPAGVELPFPAGHHDDGGVLWWYLSLLRSN